MNKVFNFIREHHLFPEIEEWEDPDDLIEDDFMYAEFYLLKKLYVENGLDLDKIKNSENEEEYEKNIDEEFSKIKGLNSNCKDFFWKRLYYYREEVIDFIKNLDLSEFNINQSGDLWFNDDYLKQFINYKHEVCVCSL